jgi:hypothetical protein
MAGNGIAQVVVAMSVAVVLEEIVEKAMVQLVQPICLGWCGGGVVLTMRMVGADVTVVVVGVEIGKALVLVLAMPTPMRAKLLVLVQAAAALIELLWHRSTAVLLEYGQVVVAEVVGAPGMVVVAGVVVAAGAPNGGWVRAMKLVTANARGEVVGAGDR